MADFGGFSGIELTSGGDHVFLVSDAGYLVEARVERDAAGRITAIVDAEARRFRQNHGELVNDFQGDAEAVRLDPQGRPVVAFESYMRFARFPTADMMPEPLNDWDRFAGNWSNEGAESLAIDATGGILAVLERAKGSPAAYVTLRYNGGRDWTHGPALATDGAFQATDADFGPDGKLYVLERNLSLLSGYATRISVYEREGDHFGDPVTVAKTAPGQFGNFEGMDVWQTTTGGLMATLVTDNNFMPDAATVILELPIGR